MSPYVISARQRGRWPRANPSLSSLGSRLVVLAAARRLRSFDAVQDRSPGADGGGASCSRTAARFRRRAVAAWQKKKKTCSRAPRVPCDSRGRSLGPHTSSCNLRVGHLDQQGEDAQCPISVLCAMTMHACTRHVTLSAGDPLLATTTTNSGSFSETKTSLYSFLSWITRNKLPRCVPKKNKTQREEYSSSGD